MSTEEDGESKKEKEVTEQLQMSAVDIKSIMETMATAALQSFQVCTLFVLHGERLAMVPQ